ncbi:hypothetical protein JW859_06915 [bacterium]|nr:hypothetical protein [bacterium]
MRYLAFEKVLTARGLLEIYSESMDVLKNTEFNDPAFEGQINRTRAEILDMAIQAYYLCGPIDYSDNSAELMAAIQDEKSEHLHYEWPPSLEELVTSGLLDYLPDSPYENSRYFTQAPADGGLPGDVIYCAYPTVEKGYFHLEPGKLENCLLFVIGRPGVFVKPPEVLTGYFLGDLDEVLPDPPENIVFLTGQLYPEDIEQDNAS